MMVGLPFGENVSQTRRPTARATEMRMLEGDVGFYYELVRQLVNHESSSIVSLGLLPYLSLCAIESDRYLRGVSLRGTVDLGRDHERLLVASRTRVKLFDDGRRDVSSTGAFLDWISSFHRQQFADLHKGLLGRLKRYLQDDLGLYFYHDEIVCTTHVAFFNMGLEREDLPSAPGRASEALRTVLRKAATDIGYYLARTAEGLGVAPEKDHPGQCCFDLDESGFYYVDTKSEHLYLRLFTGVDTAMLNSGLLLLFVSLNFAVQIIGLLVRNRPDAYFKVKFLILYHVICSLTSIQNYCYHTAILSDEAKCYMGEMLGNNEVRLIRSKRTFRNVIVHYGVNGVPDEYLDPESPFTGLVEYFFHDCSLFQTPGRNLRL